jgi:5-oxoprolinase (ATP-hydrolysing)
MAIDVDPEIGSAVFDFTGTGPEVFGNHNAPSAVRYSAVIYFLRSLLADDISLNQGCLVPIKVVIPKKHFVKSLSRGSRRWRQPADQSASGRRCFSCFSLLRIEQGCMDTLTFEDNQFGYYETSAGGAGAVPTWEGPSGIHTHSTNTRIIDLEILERRYPVLIRQFALRQGSGRGQHRGGGGVIREIEPLLPLTMSILS